MKRIPVPASVTILNKQTGKPLLLQDGSPFTKSFKDYMFDVVLNDQKGCKTPVEQALRGKIIDKTCAIPDESPDGFDYDLEDAEYAHVMPIVRNPDAPYVPLIGTQTQSFPAALEAAIAPSKTKSVAEPAKAPAEASA